MSGDEKRKHPDPEGFQREKGAYIGNRPESAVETIPGGIGDDDERVAAADSQSSGTGKAEERVQGHDDEWPAGHRQGSSVDSGHTEPEG